MQYIGFTVLWLGYRSCIIDIYYIHVVNVDYAGAFVCEVQWNQELVLETMI